MSTTAKQLIQRAVGRSTANDPDKLAKKAEMIGVLSDEVRSLYGRAQALNPWYFARVEAVAPSSSKWSPSADGPIVLWVYGPGSNPIDDRVHIVPLTDFESEIAPRIYELGREYFSVGTASDPDDTADTLNFVTSFMHAELDPTADWDAAANTLDSTWRPHHDQLLIVRLALHLAVKDSRAFDVEALQREEGELVGAFDAEVEGYRQGMTSRFG